MKKLFFYIAVLACLPAIMVNAQNVPTTAVSPSGSATRTITLPQAYNSTVNAITSTSPFNYTRTWVPVKPITNAASLGFPATSSNSAPVSTVYTDGLGNNMLSILHAQGTATGSVNKNDLVQVVDNRSSLTQNVFLPYTINAHNQKLSGHLSPFVEQKNWNDTKYPYESPASYSQSVSSSPSGIPTRQEYSPGLSFVAQGRDATTAMGFNASGDVAMYDYSAGVITITGNYPANSLTVKTKTGQHGATVKEFYDKNNQLVCKKVFAGGTSWLTNNYVYNDMGKIVCILTPKASNLTVVSSAMYDNCYTFNYDEFGNIIEKTKPGMQGPISIVYDSNLRPCMMQTPLMKAQGKWQFTIYDTRDRVVMTGYITDAHTRTEWDGWVHGDTTPTIPTGVSSLLSYLNNGFSGTYPSSISSICDIQSYNYYDTYPSITPFPGSFDASFSTSYLTYGAGFIASPAVAPVPYMFTQGILTASKIKVNDPGSSFANPWITSMYFYDQKGELIQTQTLNPWNTSTLDITTSQYDFAGEKILSITQHNSWSTCTKPTTRIQQQYQYNNFNGKLTGAWHKLDAGLLMTLSSYTYDDLKRLSSKTIGPELQQYKYNIRGQLESINADYVLGSGTAAANNSYGEILRYDYGFTNNRYDGSLAGMIWRANGIGTENRAYGYSYDAAGRLTAADFNRLFIGMGAWDHTSVDMSMSNITYGVNGNILTMNQKGTTLASGGPVDIDLLHYGYRDNGQLLYVSDDVTTDYHIGDFQDVTTTCEIAPDETGLLWKDDIMPHGPDPGPSGGGSSGVPCDDYTYDEDGNLTSDLNKHITSITYNELDKPLVITFGTATSTTGTITNVYDATGNLLKKTVVDYAASPVKTDVYSYWGPLTYLNDDLQYVLHDEGRAVWDPVATSFNYEYFIKDHLGNVRTVVKANVSPYPVDYFANHEVASAHLENSIFANVDAVRGLKAGSTNPFDVAAANLYGGDSGRRIGTAILLQVMGGDKFDVSADGYWEEDTTGTHVNATAGQMLGSIISTLAGGAGGYNNTEAGANTVNNLFSSSNYLGAYQSILDSLADTTRPMAFINYIVFNSQMQIVPEESGAIQISSTSGSWQTVGTASSLHISQNGYLAVYVSDASFSNVSWDRLNISHYLGELVQEQHYYPFGLAVNEGLAPGALPNNYLYQTKKHQSELGLNWDDFGARQYDAQIGRFWGLDPADQFPNGYTGQGNDPANNVDPSGMQAVGTVSSYQPTGNKADADVGSSDKWWDPPKMYEVYSNVDGIRTWLADIIESNSKGWSGSGGISFAVIDAPYGSDIFNIIDNLQKNKHRQTSPKHPGQIGYYVQVRDNLPANIHAYCLWRSVGDLAYMLDMNSNHYYGAFILHSNANPNDSRRYNVMPGSMAFWGLAGGIAGLFRLAEEAAEAGETIQYTQSSLKIGQEVHKAYKVDLVDNITRFKEFGDVPGVRPDFVDFGTNTIYELKPFNPRGIQQGMRQLNRYKTAFEEYYPGTKWKTVLDKY